MSKDIANDQPSSTATDSSPESKGGHATTLLRHDETRVRYHHDHKVRDGGNLQSDGDQHQHWQAVDSGSEPGAEAIRNVTGWDGGAGVCNRSSGRLQALPAAITDMDLHHQHSIPEQWHPHHVRHLHYNTGKLYCKRLPGSTQRRTTLATSRTRLHRSEY